MSMFTIDGYLYKYGHKLYDCKVKKGAFNNNDKRYIPVRLLDSPLDDPILVGYCNLDCNEQGVKYHFFSIATEEVTKRMKRFRDNWYAKRIEYCFVPILTDIKVGGLFKKTLVRANIDYVHIEPNLAGVDMIPIRNMEEIL